MTAKRPPAQRVHEVSAELLAAETSLDRSRCAVDDIGQVLSSTLDVLSETFSQTAESPGSRSKGDRDLDEIAEHHLRLCSRAAELHQVGLSLTEDLSNAAGALEHAGRVCEVLDDEAAGGELSGQLRTQVARLQAILELVDPLARGVVEHAAAIELQCEIVSSEEAIRGLHRPGLEIGRIDEDVRLLLVAVALACSGVRGAREVVRDLAESFGAVDLPAQRAVATAMVPPTCQTWR